MSTRLSPHFTLEELLRSNTALRLGIDNAPDAAQRENLRRLCLQVLEPLRLVVGRPVRITSGFRCPALNRAVGGAKHSAHLQGLAADVVVEGVSPAAVLELIRDAVVFDQAIVEHDAWLHVALHPDGTNRQQCLRAILRDGRTRYQPFPRNKGDK